MNQYKDIEATDDEIRILAIARKLKPHGTLEIFCNPDGNTFIATLKNPEKETIRLTKSRSQH